MKTVLLLIGFILDSIHFAQAQQPMTNVPRIGYLSSSTNKPTAPDRNLDAFRQGLREVGYIEGRISPYNTASQKERTIVYGNLLPSWSVLRLISSW